MLSEVISKLFPKSASPILHLLGRRHIQVSGPDVYKFLQGLTTNNVMQFANKEASILYSAFLNPKVCLSVLLRYFCRVESSLTQCCTTSHPRTAIPVTTKWSLNATKRIVMLSLRCCACISCARRWRWHWSSNIRSTPKDSQTLLSHAAIFSLHLSIRILLVIFHHLLLCALLRILASLRLVLVYFSLHLHQATPR